MLEPEDTYMSVVHEMGRKTGLCFSTCRTGPYIYVERRKKGYKGGRQRGLKERKDNKKEKTGK